MQEYGLRNCVIEVDVCTGQFADMCDAGTAKSVILQRVQWMRREVREDARIFFNFRYVRLWSTQHEASSRSCPPLGAAASRRARCSLFFSPILIVLDSTRHFVKHSLELLLLLHLTEVSVTSTIAHSAI
jgi:hypothetical protein